MIWCYYSIILLRFKGVLIKVNLSLLKYISMLLSVLQKKSMHLENFAEIQLNGEERANAL
jgi:hypothetical protein